MIKELIKIANRLDSLGLKREADTIDSILKKVAAPKSIQHTKTCPIHETENIPFRQFGEMGFGHYGAMKCYLCSKEEEVGIRESKEEAQRAWDKSQGRSSDEFDF